MTPAASAAPSSARASCCAPASPRGSGRCTATSGCLACGRRPRGRRASQRGAGAGRGPGPRSGSEAPYAYLIYPHKPIVAYVPETGELLSEYCVAFPDESRPYGSPRLPDSDDVLAKWMALTADERRLIGEANMHLPGRQVDPDRVRRDLARLRALGARARGWALPRGLGCPGR